MNPYVEQLEKTVGILKGMTDDGRSRFILTPQYGSVEKTVVTCKDDEMRLILLNQTSPERNILYLFGSLGEIVYKASECVDGGRIVDRTIRWLKVILDESEKMESLGFTQIGFTRYRLDEVEAWREYSMANGPIVNVRLRRSIHTIYVLGMEESVIRFMRERLPLEEMTGLPPELRDRIVNGVNQ